MSVLIQLSYFYIKKINTTVNLVVEVRFKKSKYYLKKYVYIFRKYIEKKKEGKKLPKIISSIQKLLDNIFLVKIIITFEVHYYLGLFIKIVKIFFH